MRGGGPASTGYRENISRNGTWPASASSSTLANAATTVCVFPSSSIQRRNSGVVEVAEDRRLPCVSDEAPAPGPVEIEIKGKVEQPPRPDGYRPITDPQWVWGQMLGVPSEEVWRTFWSAARRLDTGHRQVERIRKAIGPAAARVASGAPGRARSDRRRRDGDLGDRQGARYRSRHSGPVSNRGSLPGDHRRESASRPALRDHYSHIDERAYAKVKEKADPTAEEAFEFAAIISRREFTNGREALGLDQETTDLCIATRDYLVRAWGQITAEAHNKRQAEAAD